VNSKVRHSRARPAAMIPVAAGLLWTVLLAACSGSSPSAGSPGSQATGSSFYQDALAYSECMRTHGIADFPDPNSNGKFIGRSADRNGSVVSSTVNGVPVDTSSPQFVAANKTCEKLLPNGGQMTSAQLAQALQTALKFSRCMRAHGVANFPDPTVSDGQVTFTNSSTGQGSGSGTSGNGSGGLSPGSPQFQAAVRACQPSQGGG
jgi:hypothetical protein